MASILRSLAALWTLLAACSDPVHTLVAKTATGEQRVLVVPVQFIDVSHKVTERDIQEKVFQRVNRYIKIVSYDQASLTGKVTDWLTMPKPLKSYTLAKANLDLDHSRVRELVQTVLDRVEASHGADLDDHPYVLIYLGAKGDQYGMMALSPYPGLVTALEGGEPFRTAGGRVIAGGVTIACSNAHTGVVVHDFLHMMGGMQGGVRVVPCLYDHDIQARPGPFRGYAQFYLTPMGYWDPMSCHFTELHQPPPGICSWTRLRLGWLPPDRVVTVDPGQHVTVTLDPLVRLGPNPLAIRVPLGRGTYYLIENRQPLVVDRFVPDRGVLLLKVDDRVKECLDGRCPVRVVDMAPQVAELKNATLDLRAGKDSSYTDGDHGVVVRLLGRQGQAYSVEVDRR